MDKPLRENAYALGLLIIFLCSYSQYLLGKVYPVVNALVVYGQPVAAVSLISGRYILATAFRRSAAALEYGLGAFGVFTLLGNLAAIGIFFILSAVDPAALNLLNRANPVLHVSPKVAWMMVAVSFLMIGPAEEYLFRGFVYGGMLRIYKGRHWIVLAFLSSLLFAAAHLYYLLVYGVASIVPLVEVLCVGMALAVTYYLSGGNLLVPSIIHGAFDASGFIASDISFGAGIAIRQGMMWAGIIVAYGLFRRRKGGRLDRGI